MNDINAGLSLGESGVYKKVKEKMAGLNKKTVSIGLMFMAALILAGSFFTPLWRINLNAPQYPEGLGFNIWLHTIDGDREGELKSINNLNHYIGMKAIEPESIPELKIMPVFIAVMIFLGLLFGLINKNYLKYTWIGIFIIAGFVGLYDFYAWGYDYGHNLSSDAIIKVPGMTYQPPLIGSKTLLNFEASSYPSYGFGIIFISLVLAFFSIKSEKQNEKVKL